MANWIKIDSNILEKPEVFELCAMMKKDVAQVVHKLLMFWIWCDEHTTDGTFSVNCEQFLNKKIGKNFIFFLKKVHWLEQLTTPGGEVFLVPNWNRHNSKSAKERALAADRVKRHREKSNATVTHNVTVTALQPRNQNRIDKNIKTLLKEKNTKKENCLDQREAKKILTAEKSSAINSSSAFETFWQAYPKKTGKKKTHEIFKRINPDEKLQRKIMLALDTIKNLQWNYTEKNFIPNAATWLNQERWEDEVFPVKQTPPQKRLSAVERVYEANKHLTNPSYISDTIPTENDSTPCVTGGWSQ